MGEEGDAEPLLLLFASERHIIHSQRLLKLLAFGMRTELITIGHENESERTDILESECGQ